MLARVRKPYLTIIALLGLALGVGLGFAGCANMPSFLPTESQLVAADALSEPAPCDSLLRGRALVVTQCTSCHRFFFPCEYPSRAWPALINDMGRRALLTRRQIGDATRYMVAASRATRCEEESAASDAAWPPADADTVLRGKSLAVANCRECHRLYQPREYASDAWPRIVRSMARLASLTESEARDITSYYVETARQGR